MLRYIGRPLLNIQTEPVLFLFVLFKRDASARLHPSLNHMLRSLNPFRRPSSFCPGSTLSRCGYRLLYSVLVPPWTLNPVAVDCRLHYGLREVIDHMERRTGLFCHCCVFSEESSHDRTPPSVPPSDCSVYVTVSNWKMLDFVLLCFSLE